MTFLKTSYPSTSMNLAADEWLLQSCETSVTPREGFRLWENPKHAVIIGRSSKIRDEAHLEYCRQHQIDVHRRVSGGASVVIGPGCLMYAVVLDYRLRPHLRAIDQAHRFVMLNVKAAVEACGIQVDYQGICDLTYSDCKFSGNSLRCQQNCLLYHGTILYGFDLQRLHDCLGTPPRQPEYRQGRDHRSFVTNLPVAVDALHLALQTTWQQAINCQPQTQVDSETLLEQEQQIRELAETKYESTAWNFKR